MRFNEVPLPLHPAPVWIGNGLTGRPYGVHPTANIGGPPESREWKLGDPFFSPVIADSALIHAYCTVDSGLHGHTKIGKHSFLMARVHVGHDATIGDDCELGAGVVLCGHVEVGDRCKIGGNTWVKPFIKIGTDVVIGGGSVVVKDVPAGETWCGNPAQPIRGTHNQTTYDNEWTRWWDESRGHHR